MARRDYGFVRSYASIGRDLTQLRNLLANGYSGALFDYADPYLAQAIHDAQQAGIPFGLWGDPAHVGNDPVKFAMRMAQLNQQYRPELLVPDIEFIGKGYKGSAGWDWNQRAADAWRQYVGNARTAVSVMPRQEDFNYEAWGPTTEWLPQAYGANPLTDVFNPQDVVNTLIGRGVDPTLISPILGPGHQGGYAGSGLWTIDDFAPYGRVPFPKVSGPVQTGQPTAGGTSQSATNTTTQSKPKSRLSQNAQMIQEQGLKWGGRTFTNQGDFKSYLEKRGRSYEKWASQHQPAATALKGR